MRSEANDTVTADERERARIVERAEKTRAADAAGKREAQAFMLGMAHTVIMPALALFLLWSYGTLKAPQHLVGGRGGRGICVPLVDLLWDAFGGPFFQYENSTSPGRRIGAVARAYLSGASSAMPVWVAGCVAYAAFAKVSKRP